MFRCDVCLYETNRKFNLQKHHSRATQCKPRVMHLEAKINEETIKNNDIQNDNNVIQNESKVIQNENNVIQNANSSRNLIKHNKVCSKCDKCFQTNHNLNRHFAICLGVDSLTCNICLKKFNTRQAKNQHKNRLTKCKPIEKQETLQEANTRLMKELKLKDEEVKLDLHKDESYKEQLELHKQELKAIRDTIDTFQGLELGVKKKIKPKTI